MFPGFSFHRITFWIHFQSSVCVALCVCVSNMCLRVFFPKQRSHTERVLTATLKRLAFNRGGRRRVWHSPRRFPDKMALVKCPCAFGVRGLRTTLAP